MLVIKDALVKNAHQAIADTLRIPEKYRNYRYVKKTQISLDPKKTDMLE